MKSSGSRYRSQFHHLWSYAVTSWSLAQLELSNSRLDFAEYGSIRCDGGVIRRCQPVCHQALDMQEQWGDLTLQSVHITAVVLLAEKKWLTILPHDWNIILTVSISSQTPDGYVCRL